MPHLMTHTDIGKIHFLDVQITPWHRESRVDAQPAICSPYLGVSCSKVCDMHTIDEECCRMIFFAIALSILIFYTTDIIALTVVIPIWAVVLLLSTWPVLAANNLHVSVVGRRAIKYWKNIMQNMVIIRRQ